ncbi:non-canonical purine NTP pyrophosphatase, rdgB/HAM1 family [Luminiphilus syltensis NOR5-1B]|uniref:dITP/XTP pyrophosphatase n=1 Tax=Luminiphilus syltensis NOR5-1B TaxID=565045 RepID=B8KU82_9GAMM|nr:non-canonical purine NTP pyrophosphatase, rdgB/HAM1 family [Luminiphilus syltensis NOR5-1B]
MLASGNRGKLEELQYALQDLGWELVPQGNLNVDDADETGLTFVENALIKARHAAEITGLPSIADDSGLVVPALDGQPGIYSSRYSGEGDIGNNRKLLTAMSGLSGDSRRAWFVCVLVFLQHSSDPSPIIAEGTWLGRIASEPRGDQGFGYDPLFVPDHTSRHAAELSPAEKRATSHRGLAVDALKRLLEQRA